MDKKFVEFAENKMKNEITKFSSGFMEQSEIAILSKEIVSKIDWNNSALMHKGFSWIALNYLSQK